MGRCSAAAAPAHRARGAPAHWGAPAQRRSGPCPLLLPPLPLPHAGELTPNMCSQVALDVGAMVRPARRTARTKQGF